MSKLSGLNGLVRFALLIILIVLHAQMQDNLDAYEKCDVAHATDDDLIDDDYDDDMWHTSNVDKKCRDRHLQGAAPLLRSKLRPRPRSAGWRARPRAASKQIY